MAPHQGAVYAVAGSSGQTSGGTLDHPVMVSSLDLLGSMVIDISGPRLDARFLDTARVVRDSFAIVKGAVAGAPPRAERGGPLAIAPGRPNPFSSTTRITYVLPAAAESWLSVLDANGRRVRTLARGRREAGRHEVVWDGRDDLGRRARGGVYFVVLGSGQRTWAQKLVLAP
jgi:hypothetical protein